MHSAKKILVLAMACACVPAPLAAPLASDSEPYRYSAGDYGGVGLLQTPTARMNSQGEFTINYSDTQEYRRLAATMQLFPWLEATARYTDIRYRLYSNDPGFSGDQTLKDKGFDAKLLMWQESQWLPQVALGFRDLAGTGIFAGEYVVANKRFGDFDFSAGIGWGYLGRRDNIKNPFCEIADRMCTRPGGFTGSGGKFEVDQWFRGPAALFGGVQYDTPIKGLTLKAEYDPNDYQQDNAGRPIIVDSAWNFGAHYNYSDNLSFSAGYQRGNTFSFGFTLRTNFNTMYTPKVEAAPRKAQLAQSPTSSIDDVDFDQLKARLYLESGFVVTDVAKDDSIVTFYGYQSKYRDAEHGVDRAARVLADTLPEDISRYEFATLQDGFALNQYNVNAEQFKRAYRGEAAAYTETTDAISASNVRRGSQRIFQREQPEPLSYGMRPFLSQSFGSAETFYFYQLGLLASAQYQVDDNLIVTGKMGINLLNNFDQFNYLIDSYPETLPRVRTRIREYAIGGDVWLDELTAHYTHQFGDNHYALASVGYFERMFAGAGAEYLYRPLYSDFAFGVDLNYVKQRDPYSFFGIEDYGVVTGHASMYWDIPYLSNDPNQQSTLIVRAGRFLAEDVGTHIEFKHTFASGITAGAYAALTNVSAEEYGEGSFTKGFYLTIPFDVLFEQSSRTTGGIGWSPLFRDGGQMLYRNRQLYYMTELRD